MTEQRNKFNLKIGDIVTFTNKDNYTFTYKITKIGAKSVYTDGWRRTSWNTLNTELETLRGTINGKPIYA